MNRITCALMLCLAPLVACDKGPTKSKEAVATAATTTTTSAAPGATAASPSGDKFGDGVTLADTVAISTLLADATAYQGKTVRVEGMITDVCPKRGCWFEMAGEKPGDKLRFKVTDGVMVFPMDAKGKWAVAQGQVAVKELTLEESKQYAEYQAKEYKLPYDPATVTEPMKIVRIDGTGAMIRDRK